MDPCPPRPDDEDDEDAASSSSAPPGLRLLEVRPFRPFKSSEEYLWAMKEDLAEWLRSLYGSCALHVQPDSFCDALSNGVLLCRHANSVRARALQHEREGVALHFRVPSEVNFRPEPSTTNAFHARDNVSNFISFCRALRIKDCLLFETDDLVLKKNEKSVILCLLEVARRGSKLGMPAPLLVQMEEEIDRDIAADDGRQGALTHHPAPAVAADCAPKRQVINNDLKSLDEMVRDLVSRCTCPTQFYMERISEGKYRIGESKLTIYVRILRSHVMVRVGGGWDTLAHYLDKHDPCRCRQGHRAALASKLTVKFGPSQTQMEVSYLRSPVAPAPAVHPSPFLATPKQAVPARSASPNQGLGLTGSPPRQRRASTSSTSSSSHKLSNGSLASLSGAGDGSTATTPSPRNSTLQPHGDTPACRLSYGGDSSSEHSDEGYRGASPHLPATAPPCCQHDGPKAVRPTPPNARPTTINVDRRRRSSGEAAQLTNGIADSTLRRMQRSRSNDGSERSLEMSRNAAGRHSYRTPRMSAAVVPPTTHGNNTWSFRGRSTRPSLGADTFGGRVASPSPRGRSFGGGLRSLQTSPSKEVLTIQEIINSDLESSEKVDRIQSILNCGRTQPAVAALTNGHRRNRSATPPELASPDSGSDMGCDAPALSLPAPLMRCLKISPRKDNYPHRESKIPVPKYEALYSLQPLC